MRTWLGSVVRVRVRVRVGVKVWVRVRVRVRARVGVGVGAPLRRLGDAHLHSDLVLLRGRVLAGGDAVVVGGLEAAHVLLLYRVRGRARA
jgi:hypothetical protein